MSPRWLVWEGPSSGCWFRSRLGPGAWQQRVELSPRSPRGCPAPQLWATGLQLPAPSLWAPTLSNSLRDGRSSRSGISLPAWGVAPYIQHLTPAAAGARPTGPWLCSETCCRFQEPGGPAPPGVSHPPFGPTARSAALHGHLVLWVFSLLFRKPVPHPTQPVGLSVDR